MCTTFDLFSYLDTYTATDPHSFSRSPDIQLAATESSDAIGSLRARMRRYFKGTLDAEAPSAPKGSIRRHLQTFFGSIQQMGATEPPSDGPNQGQTEAGMSQSMQPNRPAAEESVVNNLTHPTPLPPQLPITTLQENVEGKSPQQGPAGCAKKLTTYHQEPSRVRMDDGTHLIVILGPDNADPEEDGWFAADFCLLNWLFTGLGKSQCWMTSIDLDDAVTQWGPILHGNPHRHRKVVFGAPNQERHDIQTYRHLEDITVRLTETFASASPGDNVVMIFIGHGDRDTYGLSIGAGEVLRPDLLENIITPYRYKIHLTILLTSCFSGGFVENNSINATVLAAVQRDKFSDCFQRSASGRFRGGVVRECPDPRTGSMYDTPGPIIPGIHTERRRSCRAPLGSG